MKGLKAKLFTGISMFVLALSMLIVGVWAVGETQTITMSGSVNFEIADKSLYVKDVRMQEYVNSAPYSLKDQDRFKPGFINGNFDMDLGDFTNSYGSFALYFDIINTIDETTNETFAYTVDQPTAPSGATVSVSILDTDGTTLEQIPQGTVKPSQITDSTQITATIKLTVASTSSSTVDLGNITLTINQFIPKVYDYFTFKVNDDGKTVTLTDYNEYLSDSTDVVIPATVDLVDGVWQDGAAYTVTAIADGGYYSGVFYNSGITSVTFPSSLTSIGRYAFEDCSGLTSISLPSSLTSIGSGAFEGCSGLTGELNLGECTGLTSIGSSAFSYCSGLTGTVTIPASVTEIGINPFASCSKLEGIVVEEDNSDYYIEENCLIENSTKTLITGFNNSTIPSDIKIIGGDAFNRCSKLTSISLPSSLTSIGESAFFHCDGLTGELNLGGCTSLTSIGSSAFSWCDGLTSIDLSGCTSLTSIGSFAFSWCDGLTSISLPSSLTSIGQSAFSSCSGLTGELNLGGCTSLTSIGNSAFRDCSGLTSISLPSSLKAIGISAFSSCSGLTGELNLGGCTSLTRIGDSAFSRCSGLTSVTLPSSLTSIGSSAFYNCSALESVVFPEGSTGWYVTRSSTATSGTSVTVTDPSVNADNLTGRYYDYDWKRG